MKLKFFIPLFIFLFLMVLLYRGLSLDPKKVPSPLINKAAPDFVTNTLYQPDKSISPKDMLGKVWILNVFASWCVSCRAEHAVVSRFAKTGLADVIGLNYKDEEKDAKEWLAYFTNPYKYIAVDRKGQIGIDWGVYGVPESFVIDKKGIIRYKQIGPITEQALEETIIPLIKRLQKETS